MAFGAVLFSLAATASADEAPPPAAAPAAAFSIAPDQEKAIGDLLGIDGTLFPGGCTLKEAKIDQSLVRATYSCQKKEAGIQLMHPSTATSPAAKTEHFAIVGEPAAPPPPALVQALAERIRKGEGNWVWQSPKPEPAKGSGVEGVPPEGEARRGPALSGEDRAEYDRAMEIYQKGDPEGAYRALYSLAERLGDRAPGSSVLGLLVAALASRSPTVEMVNQLGAAADAQPDDFLKQFVAGVAAHYHGHQSGTSKEDKSHYYELTLKYLDRVHPKLDMEPRVWIYTAVSYYRTGRQEPAEQAIAKAIELGSKDADIYYCRAEIFHRKNPQQAIDDMKRYMEIVEANKKEGTIVNESKEAKVRTMYEHMQKVARGELPADAAELFDPPHAHERNLTAGAIGAVLLAGVAVFLVRRRKGNRA